MAGLSAEDGLVMQLPAGARRGTDRAMHAARGPNMGADMPQRSEWAAAPEPLPNRHGADPNLPLILFTLDEGAHAREPAPMAGDRPCLMLGPPREFHDSPAGKRRFLDQVHETAGFANLAGFNDDTRALLSIPARHDVRRRAVAGFLAGLVADHRLDRPEAARIAADLALHSARRAHRL
jgi:glucuronate isomerase